MKRMTVETEFGTYHNCYLEIGKYSADDTMAITILSPDWLGPVAKITVCVPGSSLAKDETVLDTNNCPWALEFIKKYELGLDTGRRVSSGFCVYPIVKLNLRQLRKYTKRNRLFG